MNAMTSPMALAKAEPAAQMRSADRAFEPTNMEEAWRLAKILVAGGMMPRHLRTPEAVFSVIAAGRELGLTALQSTRSLYFIEGKVVLSADLMVALAKRHEECEYFRIVEASSERCVCETKREGEQPTRMEWTMADAERAGLTGKDNWKKYPKAMLRARVAADLCRAVYPDALMGVYEPDELQREPQRTATTIVVPETPAAPPPQLARTVEYDHETGEVAPEPPQSGPHVVADELADLAKTFIDRIHAAETTAQLLDLKAESKKVSFPELLRLPLSESFLKRKKVLEAAEKLASEA